MSLKDLDENELKVIGDCLKAVAYGTFFPDDEFESLFGLSRSEMKEVADRFPNVDENDDSSEGNDDSWLAINNTLVNLLGYPHGKDLSEATSAPAQELEKIYKKWKGVAT